MATIYIDGNAYEADQQQNLLRAATTLGIDIPYFCWHPALGSVGACRLCAVKQFKDENDDRGKIVMSCMTPVSEGLRVSVNDDEAAGFRKAVIEFLMANHPHDCPICDEGGECHLQDMTLMARHYYRERRFAKRTFRNQNLGPLINHEMNRCIQCYRCERFYADYAGGDDLQHFGAHDHVYFGRYKDGPFRSEFSGNLVEVCPTGVFTDKTLKQHYARKWDLQTSPSICSHCSVGCNIIPGERYGTIRRIRSRYNGQVNRYFICDRGRYGYGFVNSDERIRKPTFKTDANSHETRNSDEIRSHITHAFPEGARAIGIGSPRASLESNYAMRRLVGEENFFAGLSEDELHLARNIVSILKNGPARTPSLHEMHKADAVFILGEDVTNTAPMIDLALRQAVKQARHELSRSVGIPDWHDAAVRDAAQGKKSPLYIATTAAVKLDEIAKASIRATPNDIARLGHAVANRLDSQCPAPEGLSNDELAMAKQIADDLKIADNPLILSGTSANNASIAAAANVAWALKRNGVDALLSYALPECNSMGLAMMADKALDHAEHQLESGSADILIVLENDLYRRSARKRIDALLDAAKERIVIDHTNHETANKARITLPAASFAEGDGAYVNHEGRAQRFYQVFSPQEEITESWRWIQEIALASGRFDVRQWDSLDDIVEDLSDEIEELNDLKNIAPPASYRIAGQKIPRQQHRHSGRTAIDAHKDVHEPKPPADPDSPMSFSMEGYRGRPPSQFINEFWSPGWNSANAVKKFQSEVGGPLHGGDPGRRLIEADPESDMPYFKGVPEPFKRSEDEFLLVPLYHIFGSEELSVLSQGIGKLAARPYLAIHPRDASRQSLKEVGRVGIEGLDEQIKFPLQLNPSLPRGVVGYPAGLPQLAGVSFPEYGRLRACPEPERRAAPQ